MPTVELDYRPFLQQIKVHWAARRWRKRAVVTGRRGGKTTLGVRDKLDGAIQQPKHVPQDVLRGEPYRIGIGAPRLIDIKRVILPELLRSVPAPLVAKRYHATDHWMAIHGRLTPTEIYFISCERGERGWPGLKLHEVWLDEFPLIRSEHVYDEVLARLSDRNGSLLLTGTPHGPNWALERIYNKAAAIVRHDGSIERRNGAGIDKELVLHTWYSIANPHGMTIEEYEQHRSIMPARTFRRFFEASFETFAGQVYEEFIEQVHVVDRSDFTFRLPDGRRVGSGKNLVIFKEVVAGVDWGFGSNNPGAIVVCGITAAGIWYLVDLSYATGVVVFGRPGADSWVARAQTLRARWNVDLFYVDPESPEAYTHFRQNGLRVRKAKNAQIPGIQEVAKLIHVDDETCTTHLYVLSDLKQWIDEARYYHWDDKREKPVKTHDHAMDATRYAVYTHGHKIRREAPGWSPPARVERSGVSYR